MTPERQAVLDAIKDLVADEDPRPKLEALEAVYTLARRYPVALVGSMSHLNPLIQVRLASDEEWEVIKVRIDVRREKEGLDPCWPPPAPTKFTERYNEYQKNLMQAIRDRTRRASAIENMLRGPKDQLRGNTRIEFERRVHLDWGRRRDALLADARERAGEKWTREMRRALTDKFWHDVDVELAAREAHARIETIKPAHLRKRA